MNSNTRRVLRRIVSLMFSFAIVISTMPSFPTRAYAAALDNENTSYDVKGWSTSGTTLKGEVTGTGKTQCDEASSTRSKLTMRNDKPGRAKLSFSYEKPTTGPNGTVKINDTIINEAGTYSVELEKKGTITIELYSGDPGANTTSFTINNIQIVVSDIITTSFVPPVSGGTYTVASSSLAETTVDSEFTNQQLSTESYTLIATASPGYKFAGWQSSVNGYMANTNTYSVMFEEPQAITAIFVKDNSPVFKVGKQLFDDLNDATSYATSSNNNKIVLIDNGQLSAGSYEIPNGKTLLIPCDAVDTLYTTTPNTVSKYVTPSVYKNLTMLPGSNIVVNGSISIAGSMHAASGGSLTAGAPSGPLGRITMESGSHISMNKGSKLYAWGYIIGDGTITALDGSEVFEDFQMTEFRGGSILVGLNNNDKKVFPLSQYYVQNIEAPLEIQAGAIETVVSSVTADGRIQTASVKLIAGNNALFNIRSGSLVKSYISSLDRCQFNIDGSASISAVNLSIGGVGLNSANYILPINSNMDINIVAGNVSISNNIELLPDAKICISEGANCTIESNKSVFVYDINDWGNYVFSSQSCIPVQYSPTRTITRKLNNDAVIDVNGTLDCYGHLYTTNNGASIISSKASGVVNFHAKPTTGHLYQTPTDNKNFVEIAVKPAWLKNLDESYVYTESVDAGTSIPYSIDRWMLAKNIAVHFLPNATDVQGTMPDQKITVGQDGVLNRNQFVRPGYSFVGWSVSETGEGEVFEDEHVFDSAATIALGELTDEVTLYAQWKKNEYTVTFQDEDGTLLQSTKVEYGATPEYTGETPTKAATAQYAYEFAGWSPEVSPVTGDATYTATYSSTVKKYTVRFLNEDGTELQSSEVDYGAMPEYAGETPAKAATAQYTYEFAGWSPEVSPVTGDATYTATYTSTVNKYTVRFVNEDGTELQSSEVEYGMTPQFTGETPTKAADAQYSYVFDGWDPLIVPVDGEATYTAKFKKVTNKYTVTWNNADGTELLSAEYEYGATPEYTGETPTKAATAQYTYEFAGWSPEVSPVTGNVTYTATYRATVNKYTVRFLNEDGTELQSSKVEYGVVPTFEGDAPTKDADAQYSYVFAGWDKNIVAVTEDATYVATYEKATNRYEVKFYNEDGTELQSETLEFGTRIRYNGNIPTKPADAEYTYTFSGWIDSTGNVVDFDDNENPVSVVGPSRFVATYKKSLNKYTVKFVNEDGTELQSSDVAYGTVPEYVGETPTKKATDQYTYVFAGWTPLISEVTGDITYTATFTSTVNKYTIVFLNEDGSELQSSEFEYGALPEYTGATPTKATDAQYTYTFTGWDKKVTEVTGNATYIATYSKSLNSYTITFKNESGTVLQSAEVKYGERPVYTGETPTKDATDQFTYRFIGWSDGSAVLVDLPEVVGDATYTATFAGELRSYQITFEANGGKGSMEPQLLGYGTEGTIQANSFTKQGSIFIGWNTEANGSGISYENAAPITITGDVTLYAQWALDGWQKSENGDLTYYIKGELQKSGWTVIDGKTYYLDPGNGVAAANGIYWLPRPEGYEPDQWNIENNEKYAELGYLENSYFIFADDGQFQETENGLFTVSGDAKVVGGAAQQPTADFVVWASRGEIPWHAGLVQYGGYYYYFTTGGFEAGKTYVKSQNYDMSKTNGVAWPEAWGDGVFSNGKYTFDAQGHLVLNDGLVDVGADTFYYVKGVLTYAGLIKLDDTYYYVKSDFKLAKNRDYYVSKTNGLMEAGSYKFDAEGKMINLNGIVKDGETWYYYENGNKTYAGLIKIGDDYYYVKSDCTVVHGRDYFVSKANGLMPQGTYTFDSEGRLVVLDGIVKDGDVWTYYVDGAKTYAGLIKIGGDCYYVKSDCTVVHGKDYFVSKANGLMPQGTYTFDSEGKMVIYDGILKDGDTWTYFVNNAKVYAGLIEIDGDYYYVKSDCTVVHGRDYYVSKTNNLKPQGTYTFDADGKMQ